MATPNYDLEIKRCRFRISQIELARENVLLRIAELEDEKKRLEENLPGYDAEIAQVNEQIDNFAKLSKE